MVCRVSSCEKIWRKQPALTLSQGLIVLDDSVDKYPCFPGTACSYSIRPGVAIASDLHGVAAFLVREDPEQKATIHIKPGAKGCS